MQQMVKYMHQPLLQYQPTAMSTWLLELIVKHMVMHHIRGQLQGELILHIFCKLRLCVKV